MKLSVSVPDELWERSKEMRPELPTSRLIQEALEAWTSPGFTAGYSLSAPKESGDLFEAAVGRFVTIARKEFEAGYTAAAKAAKKLDWWNIESLHDKRYDVPSWVDGYSQATLMAAVGQLPSEFDHSATMNVLVEGLGSLVDFPGTEEMFRPSAPYLRGYAQAMRDLWRRVNYGGPGEASTSGEEVASES